LLIARHRKGLVARRSGFRNEADGRIAQLVEQLTLNQRVLGSNPSAPTKLSRQLDSIGRTHCDTGSAVCCDTYFRFVLASSCFRVPAWLCFGVAWA
jgi:hypothetical protein